MRLLSPTDAVLRVDDVVFWGGEGEEGFFLAPDGFEGWEDTPDVRFEQVERERDGDFDSPSWFGSRLLVVSGKCLASSEEQLGWYGSRLRGLLRGKKRYVVNYQGTTSYADGRLASAIKFRTALPGREARFQFSARFVDPRRFGERTSLSPVAGGVDQIVYHRGDFPASPQLIVSGAMPGYRIDGPGGSITVGRAVAAATPHVIDLSTGLLSINGVVQFGAITAGGPWTIAPGQIATHRLVPASGTGTLETVIRNTYV